MKRVLTAFAVIATAFGYRLHRGTNELDANSSSLVEAGSWPCRKECAALSQQAQGCCYHEGNSCQWCAGGRVGSSTLSSRWSTNCQSGTCDSWSKGKWCTGSCTGWQLPEAGWKLEWADEFYSCPNGRPDPAKWDYEIGYSRNYEYQWYQKDNARCVDGNLVITARKENPPDWVAWGASAKGLNYTSSALITKGLKTFNRGRYEFRAQIPIDSGLWPAWWLLGDLLPETPWPNLGEIDMMEFYRGKVLANFAYGNNATKAVWDSEKKAVSNAWASRFHTWAMEWDQNKLIIFLDGQEMNRFRVSAADGTGHVNPYKGDVPWYMLINLAIGGVNGGDPAGTQFPIEFKVDYVRYYRWGWE